MLPDESLGQAKGTYDYDYYVDALVMNTTFSET